MAGMDWSTTNSLLRAHVKKRVFQPGHVCAWWRFHVKVYQQYTARTSHAAMDDAGAQTRTGTRHNPARALSQPEPNVVPETTYRWRIQ